MVVLDVVQIIFRRDVVVAPQRLREARRLFYNMRVREDEVPDDVRSMLIWEIYLRQEELRDFAERVLGPARKTSEMRSNSTKKRPTTSSDGHESIQGSEGAATLQYN